MSTTKSALMATDGSVEYSWPCDGSDCPIWGGHRTVTFINGRLSGFYKPWTDVEVVR